MEDKLVEFETAKLAKDKGFNIPVIWGYSQCQDSLYAKSFEDTHCYNVRGNFSAPTQSLLQKWLREVHKKFLYPEYIISGDDKGKVRFGIMESSHLSIYTKYFDSYEQALEEGLQAGLKLIK